LYNKAGIDIPKLLEFVAKEGTVSGFPGGEPLTNEQVFYTKCDILVPAALGGVLTESVASRVECKIIAEAANNPTTLEADRIFDERHIPVIPDILCNAGGVTVSYFEWSQNLQQYRWDVDQVNTQLKK
jgi:glutamate dehydrogenase (NAD(P)+)